MFKNFHKKKLFFPTFLKSDKIIWSFQPLRNKILFLKVFKRFEPTKKVLMI